MIRLGLRLATSAGRASAVSIALTATAVALGTAILLFALSFSPALDDRYRRSAWRVPVPAAGATGGELLYLATEDRYGDRPLLRFHLAPVAPEAAPPPGVDRVPDPGEAFVSPALAEQLRIVPADQLGGRIGRVVGTIAPTALRSPDELVAIIGSDADDLREQGALAIDGFVDEPVLPDLPPIMVLMVILAVAGALAPVAVFVGTATRLSAARREGRLAALRLVGATPGQVRKLAVVEALVPSLVGAAAGVALFWAARPLVALVPLDGATWFPESIAPSPLPAVVLVALVPVVGAVAAIASLRRVVITPLGVQRRQTPPRPTALRLIPLAAAVVVLVTTLVVLRGRVTETLPAILVVAGSFAGIVGGMAMAGPWLTSIVGRALSRWHGGAVTLLASRRLTDDPRGSFGAIAGVVMAVFVASAFFTFAGYARAQARLPDTAGPVGVIQVTVPQLGGPDAGSVVERLRTTSGVVAVVPVAGAELFSEFAQVPSVWVVDCDQLLTVPGAPLLACGDGPVRPAPWTHLPPGAYQLAFERAIDGVRPSVEVALRARDVRPVEWEVLVEGSGIGMPDVLIDPDAFDGALGAVPPSLLTVVTDGTPAAEERIRTVAAAAYPLAYVRVLAEPPAGEPMFEEFGRVVHLGLIGSLLLAGCSLAVAVTTAILERRREFALLRSAGMPVSRLRALVMVQAGVPLVAVASFSAVLGIVVAQAILMLAQSAAVPLPDPALGITLALSVASALGIVALTLPALERMTRPETARME